MAPNLIPRFVHRWLSGLLAILIGLGPLANPVFAQAPPFTPNGGLTPLADEPLNVKVSAKPNIILTVDDSTSMLSDFLPDYVVKSFCRDGSGKMNATCGFPGPSFDVGLGGKSVSPQYIWEQYSFPYTTYTTGGGAYSVSGPGQGCNLSSAPPTCSGGISPGALPGIALYPAASGSPGAGTPYEYWLLWPAPGHNSALNALYYDPRLTYDPPVDSTGASYQQMDAGNTSNWTSVPTDVWATTVTYADLTATVTVGQWCNSDWTQGNDDSGSPFLTNASYCRTNGLVSASSSPVATGDYMYPWLPVSITNAAPDYVFYESKVDITTINTSTSPPVNATVKPAWAGAQNSKYFYENENVLWCDITSPDWPSTASNPRPQTCDMTNPTTQTCNGYRAVGTCSATASGNCAGYTAGVCNTGNGTCANFVAGACNTSNGNCSGTNGTCNLTNGNCSGTNGTCNTANGNCNGVNGTCNLGNGNCSGFTAGVCGAGQAGVCGAATSCNATRETCIAGTAAACQNITGQTCNGTPIACNPVAQVCNGASSQTCVNIHQLPLTGCHWVPDMCNTDPNPEVTCNYVCDPPVFQGNCSIDTALTCQADANCPFHNGACSVQTARSCAVNGDCNGLNYCQSTTNVCSTSADCGVTNGTCSVSSAACSVSNPCAATGTCNYKNNSGVTNGICASVADCQSSPSYCATTTSTTGCAVGPNSASCPLIPNSGTCQYSATSGGACTTIANCSNKCQNSLKLGTVCASSSACDVSGHCTAGKPAATVCVINTDCQINGSCTTGVNTGAVCTANGANATCGAIDRCSAGLPNTTVCTTNAMCNTGGTCTSGVNTGAACTGSGANAACGAVNKCTVGNVGAACTVNTQCNTAGTCTTGVNTGTACTGAGVNATCGPIDRCSAGLPNTTVCTTNAMCNTSGVCTTGVNTGVACTGNGANPTCGAINKCSAGKPATTPCTTAGQCNVNGTCQSGSNTGAACTANGVNATCGAVNKCSAGQPATTSCTANATCDLNGACTTGSVGTACTVNGTTAQCALANGFCSNYPPNTQGCTVANAATQCAGSTGYCSIDSAQTCTVNGDCLPYGKCTITGAQCRVSSQATDCPVQQGPINPLNARCDTTGISGNAATTLLADANGPGKACRRNNHAYVGVSAAPYNYPSGNFTTPVTGEIVAGQGCAATNRYANTPRHYWKTSIEWCDKQIATLNDEWWGYGTDQGGTCQAGKDSTHIYPRFYQFGAASYVNNDITTGGTAAFQRVDLDISKRGSATYTHNWFDVNGQPQTITRSFDEEMTNYANWFAYYRTRILAVKTVTSLSFSALDDQYRVGFHTLSNGVTTSQAQSDPAVFVDIQDFDAGQKAKWFTQLFAIQIPLGLETPTLDAMARIGDYFLNGTHPDLSGSTDPIVQSCQKNWHMLFTDGFTNQAALPATKVNDQDDSVLSLPQPVAGLTVGQPWPAPFREDPNAGAANAASDYAMNYWVTDLRPSGPQASDNVPTTSKDPASWQHLNFAAMSLGTQGKLPVANQSLTENQLASGALQWPQPYPNTWKPDNSGVDDLWHAAINGRGRFVNASSADELKLGMGQILQDITNQAGSRAGVGLASSSISLTNHAVYRVTFQPGWAGTLTKINIDPVTGLELLPYIWEASQQLHNQLSILPPPNDTPWFTKRSIFTTAEDSSGKAINGAGTGIPFVWGSLSGAQQDSLAPGLPAVGQAVLEFLRGNPTNEGVATGQFRVRATASFGENFLGDIVDSQAVYVGAPNAPYLSTNDPGYIAWAAGLSGRSAFARIYVGGNDGMLHAFDDNTGDETWAYIPHDLYRGDATGLGALAYQDGALPPFRHHYLVDSTPRIIDANFGGGLGDWHTLLVGGLGKGGKSYYALDVTNPSSVSNDTTASAQYLWTFTDPDLGYTYGRPMVAKTRAFGGRWLVIVSAGYDNTAGAGATGQGKVFFIDAATGAKLYEMSTGVGDTNNPAGMAQIAGYTQDFHNQLVDQIYGGDLYGNFWRFNLMDSNEANWTVQQIAYFTDPVNGNPQPVTTPPQIEVDIANGVDRWVFVGTGRLLEENDLTDAAIAGQIQTFYAIRDGTTTTPDPRDGSSGPAILQRTDLTLLADRQNGLAGAPATGWYDDLPAGERMITAPQAALGVVAYVGTSPQDNPCLTGQPATLYVREFALGDSLLRDASGGVLAGLPEVQGAVGLDITIFTDSSGPASASGVDIRIAVTAGTTGDVTFQPIKPPTVLAAHRMSWRLLGQ
jgi:type IV pilus assembly protein PilY1